MANQSIPAVCDQGCKKSFTINKFRTQKVKGGNEKTFFRCPHCRCEYIAYYSSKETERLQKQMRKLHQDAYVKDAGMDMELFRKEETALKARIKQSMDEARKVSEA